MTVCPEGDVWIHALNKRQLIQQEHESLTRTAWQNAAELFHLQACFLKPTQTFPDFFSTGCHHNVNQYFP